MAVEGRRDKFETLSAKAYHHLRDAICSGALPPATRLVRRTLSKQLGMSPNPITEAILRLEHDGLVESQPMYGSRVRTWTLEEVRGEAILREALECEAAVLCTENTPDSQIQELSGDAMRLDEAYPASHNEGQEDFFRAHMGLHVKIARSTGIGALEAELQRLWRRRWMPLDRLSYLRSTTLPRNWHQQLLAAIASRDPARAEAQMRRHVRFGWDQYAEVFQQAQRAWEAGQPLEGSDVGQWAKGDDAEAQEDSDVRPPPDGQP